MTTLPAHYRMDLAYLGTGLFGWQSQAMGRTVQDHLEQALAIFLRHPVRILGASRTDTGVHAAHQVATFKSAVPYDEQRWLKALEHLLPKTIGVRSILPVPAAFHPMRATGKVYLYRIWRGPTVDPFVRQLVWRLMPDIDLALLRAETSAFVGRHDFSAFCAADSSAKTKTREVYAVECHEHGAELRIWVVGKGFLKQQIRIMVGTLVEVARGKRAPGAVTALLQGGDRTAAGRTAPAEGLTLMRIVYEEDVMVVFRDLLNNRGGYVL